MRIGAGIFNLVGNRSLTIPLLILTIIVIFILIPIILLMLENLVPETIKSGCTSRFWNKEIDSSGIFIHTRWGLLLIAMSVTMFIVALIQRIFVLRLSDLPTIFVWFIFAFPFLSLSAFALDWTRLDTNKMTQLRLPTNYDPLVRANKNQLVTKLDEAGISLDNETEALNLIKRTRFQETILLDRFEEGPAGLFVPKLKRPFTELCRENIDLDITTLDERGFTNHTILSVNVFTPVEEVEKTILDGMPSGLVSKALYLMSVQSAVFGSSKLYWFWLQIFIIQAVPIFLLIIMLLLYDKKILKLKGD